MENKHDVCRGYNCMKNFSEILREYAMKIINFKKKKILVIKKQQQESYENAKICYICKEKIENKYRENKKCCKVWDHFYCTEEHRGAAHTVCILKNRAPKKFL